MHELVDLSKFHLAMQLIGLTGLPAGVGVGALLGRLRGQMRWYLTRGVLLGLLGPLIYGLWLYYRWMVRLEPATGYVGLHKPSVLLICLGVFTVVGVILGRAYGRITRRSGEGSDVR